MATEVSICNDALGKIGARNTITSLSQTNSNEALKCNLFYAETRDEILQMGGVAWGFASGLLQLDLWKQAPGTPGGVTSATEWSSDYPAPPWLYSYEYPDDIVAVNAIVPVLPNYGYPYILAAAAAFQLGSDTDGEVSPANIQVILTNVEDAIAVVTKQITEVSLFSPLFRSALSYALAAKLAPPLTGDKELTKTMFALANAAIMEARANLGNQGLTIIDQQAEWILARQGLPLQAPGNYLAPYSPLYLA